MIYFDNSATTLHKPPAAIQAVYKALSSLGNPGRSFHSPAMDAARIVYRARCEIAELSCLNNPLNISFTSGATESLTLVLNSLLSKEDHVITSVFEHNSVLRPLYKIGCELSYIPCDEQGQLILDSLSAYVKKNTRCLVCMHGSNLIGTISDTKRLYRFCQDNNLIFVLDVSQTFGSIETLACMADVLCFTGHKALMGPQGTGGIISDATLPFMLVKTGGSGSNSFDTHQPLEMPDIFEAGTPNTHGLAGLAASVKHINALGVAAIAEHESRLCANFIAEAVKIPGLRIYGHSLSISAPSLPVVALNIGDISAGDVSLQLWEKWQVATRAGSHCAPLLHKYFKTEEQGMVRFSFGFFNTEEEVDTAIGALWEIAKQMG